MWPSSHQACAGPLNAIRDAIETAASPARFAVTTISFRSRATQFGAGKYGAIRFNVMRGNFIGLFLALNVTRRNGALLPQRDRRECDMPHRKNERSSGQD